MSPVASAADIRQAAEILFKGELVAFPTETVYGLGADADSPQAVAKIYLAKGRPSSHPVIVHVAQPQDIQHWCCDIAPQAWDLAQAFWPGPLTMILKRHPDVDASVSGGQDTIGVRCPSHPVAHALLTEFAELKTKSGQVRAGVAAPSANRFGRVSPTRAMHVRDEFGALVSNGLLVLEGGASEVGIESTIVDLSTATQTGQAALLRPGAISAADLARILGRDVSAPSMSSPRVSGSLKAHYAPTTPLVLCPATELVNAVARWLATNPGRVAVLGSHEFVSDDERVVVLPMPNQAADFARDLYATLRAVDDLSVSAVICEQVPQGSEWDGVRDRLSRAAAAFDCDSSA